MQVGCLQLVRSGYDAIRQQLEMQLQVVTAHRVLLVALNAPMIQVVDHLWNKFTAVFSI